MNKKKRKPNRKMSNLRDNTKQANRCVYVMGCSNAIVIREIQNKTALRFHSTPFKLAKLER